MDKKVTDASTVANQLGLATIPISRMPLPAEASAEALQGRQLVLV